MGLLQLLFFFFFLMIYNDHFGGWGEGGGGDVRGTINSLYYKVCFGGIDINVTIVFVLFPLTMA